MVTELFPSEINLRSFFASQALTGLLANGQLNPSMSGNYKVSPDGAKQLAVLAFDIAEAMVNEATTEKRSCSSPSAP